MSHPNLHECRKFIAAMMVNPYDIAPRLIYADYLEENGFLKLAVKQRYFAGLIEKGKPSYILAKKGWSKGRFSVIIKGKRSVFYIKGNGLLQQFRRY